MKYHCASCGSEHFTEYDDPLECPCGCGGAICAMQKQRITFLIQEGLWHSQAGYEYHRPVKRKVETVANTQNDEAREKGRSMAKAIIGLGRAGANNGEPWDVDIDALQALAQEMAAWSGYRELAVGLAYVQGFTAGATELGARLVSRNASPKQLTDGKG